MFFKPALAASLPAVCSTTFPVPPVKARAIKLNGLAIKSIPIISRFSIIVARRVYKKIGNKILKQKNLENYNNSGKIYISNFGKIVETFLSFYDLLKLFFISSKVHLKHNEYKILNEEINIDDKI